MAGYKDRWNFELAQNLVHGLDTRAAIGELNIQQINVGRLSCASFSASR